jgi:uncharacterized protein
MTMKKKPLFPSALICSGLSLLLIWGCASSPPSRFYTLSPLSGSGKVDNLQLLEKGPMIGLGPVRFPDYLDRPGIVTRTNKNTIKIAEFDLWAGSVKENFILVLSENLSQLLGTSKILQYPYFGPIPTEFRLLLSIHHFEGTPGKEAALEATWAILEGPEKKTGIVHTSRITEPISGSDYQSLVAAQSRIVEHLSREIAQAIKVLPSYSSSR